MGKFENNALGGFILMLAGIAVGIIGEIELFISIIPYCSVVTTITQTLLILGGLYFIMKGVIKYGII